MTVQIDSGRRSLLLSVLFATLITFISFGLGIWVLADPGIRAGFVFYRVARTIDGEYAGDINWRKSIDASTGNIFGQLDRYSEYLESKDFDDLSEEMSGGYQGIGVSVIENDSGLLVMSVREGGPASEVGILSGDVIIRIDTTSLVHVSVTHASDLLRGPEGSKVRLTIARPTGGDTLTVEPVRRRIYFQHVPFAGYTPDSMIYIRLLDFDAGASEDLEAALDSLLNRPGYKPNGLILDLKGNPGGLFTEAYNTSSLFLPAGKFIVGTSSRSRWNEEKHYSDGVDVTQGLPMVVLVDRGSASAAEIVSGSLKQLGRAKLIGDTTFGKGLVQGYSRFPDGDGGKLTIARYYLEGNLYLNRFDTNMFDTGKGLAPDYRFAYPEDKPFIAELEGSLLLMRFAQQHQDDLLSGPPPLGPDTGWVSQFATYCEVHKFSYKSPQTEAAELMVLTARTERASPETIKSAEDLLLLARRTDRADFFEDQDYIMMRLRQLACERKYGVYRAWTDIVIENRPDIKYAEQVLREEAR
jgi:carboxyl-terminal processing protease